tara:strand:+ start:229 stop:507 length:279 start_codon:yes stop_codon:yes gene_type:complete
MNIYLIIILIQLAIIAYLVMLYKGKIKDIDKDFIADSVEDKIEEIHTNAVNKFSRLKEELKDIVVSIKEVGNQIEDLPKALKNKRTGRKKNA